MSICFFLPRPVNDDLLAVGQTLIDLDVLSVCIDVLRETCHNRVAELKAVTVTIDTRALAKQTRS